jgi:hypothetical protein
VKRFGQEKKKKKSRWGSGKGKIKKERNKMSTVLKESTLTYENLPLDLERKSKPNLKKKGKRTVSVVLTILSPDNKKI